MTVRKGEIYYANLNPTIGSEQGGIRPVVIIQNDVGNKFSTTTIAAITTKAKHSNMPTHVPLNSKYEPVKDSVALLEQLRTIDKTRLLTYVGMLSEETMQKIDHAFLISIGAINPQKKTG